MKIRKVALSAAAATLGLVAMAAPAAAAAPSTPTPLTLPQGTCNVSESAQWCLFITKPDAGVRQYRIDVGIDLRMSQRDAQEIIDAPGDPLTVQMWDDDVDRDHPLFRVPAVSLHAAESGLSADFAIVVSGAKLDVDAIGEDEVFAGITFRDPRTGQIRTFDTTTVRHAF